MRKALLAGITAQDESYLFETNVSSPDGPRGESLT